MSSSVDLIKEKLEIADIIGAYLKLERAGNNLKGKCPFHNEKTPSFFVSPDRGTYYCFGCGAKGDMFTFVQEFEGLDFRGALKSLAARAGVTLEQENPQDRSEKERFFSALAQSAFFFQKKLEENTEAKKYLLGRGLTEESIKDWAVGYAPLDWRQLHDFLLTKGFTKAEMEHAGLVKKSEKSQGEYYDVFRGRIMFPISDSSGRVIAFSGRILVADEKSPKYLNTPETVLFNKSQTLYGLHKAKMDIRRLDYSVLVEGQMDLVMAHQAGFANTVASSGTAFTKDHLDRLKRLSNRIIMAFDADGAGFTASNKSAQLALSLGMEVKIAPLPKGTDPAELIRTDIGAWKESLKISMHIIDFYMKSLLTDGLDPRNMDKEVRNKILPYIAMLSSSMERSRFISKIASQIGAKEDALWEDLRTFAKGMPVGKESASPQASPTARKNSIERKVLGIVLWQESLSTRHSDINTDDLRARLEKIIGGEDFKNLVVDTEPSISEIIFEVEAYYHKSDTLLQDVDELFANLDEERLKESFTKTMNDLQIAERDKDPVKIKELLTRCQEISQKIASLPKKK